MGIRQLSVVSCRLPLGSGDFGVTDGAFLFSREAGPSAVREERRRACTVVVPNLENTERYGKFLAEIDRGGGGFGELELSECGLAWENLSGQWSVVSGCGAMAVSSTDGMGRCETLDTLTRPTLPPPYKGGGRAFRPVAPFRPFRLFDPFDDLLDE